MWVIIIAVVGLIIFVVAPSAANLYTEWLWFQSVGQSAVFLTVLTAQLTLFALGAGVFLALAMINLLIARLVARHIGELPLPREGVLTYITRMKAHTVDRIVTYGALICALILAAIMGLVVSSNWLMFERYLNPSSFAVKDPLFGLDVSFFVFQLPFYHFVQGWLIAAVILIAALTGAYYAVRSYGFTFEGSDLAALASVRGVRIHFFTLAALLPLLLAVGYRLDIYDLVYANRGVVHGAGFADVNAQLPALAILGVIAVLMAVAVFVNAFRRGYALAGVAVAGWIVAAIVVGGVYPSLVQQLGVQPSELTRETPYLQENINMTRRAFGLDNVDSQPFPGDAAPAPGVVGRNPQTFGSIRLWDDRPLLSTYNQIQTIRLYYDFSKIGIDRYTIDGKYQQVMLSARELSPSKLASQAQTWVTQRLQFTHGYGFAMSPVNEVTSEGLPDLIEQDIPPTGKFKVTRPEIYFDETGSSYVILDTSAPEFDYPQGNQNVYNSYQGNGGVPLNSPLRKLAFSILYQDPNILLTSYLLPQSQIMYHRQITDRVNRLAPFLIPDSDPYLVVSNGQLYWFQDFYTVTSQYPYSTPYGGRFNYIRNSVKAVTNAYDGSVHLYVSDPTDPLVQTYAKVFPTLFSPLSAMPTDLHAHIRYPEDMFLVQADVLRAYHMKDAQVFYNREDMWDMPQEVGTDGSNGLLQPYYVIMRLPDAKNEEFLLMLPFTPSGKTNMVAWLAARSDGADYGKMLLFEYPKDKVIFGPQQVEARIDQNPQISAQLSLWNQQGSKVVRGNLLVIPIEKSTLYVEPLYLQASQSQLPELTRVILATEDKLVMGTSLDDALNQLFGTGTAAANPSASVVPAGLTTATGTTAAATPTPAATTATAAATPSVPGSVSALVQSANDDYDKAQAALKSGDWTTYGQEQKALESDLKKLIAATGNPSP
ncbi:MAG TPA: UPF0182 family protein [Chloroflexota bacterium]|nr:UPF0182 family protein [Chloroflexota bacterium]